jgi:tetratricopeptide (TPR) repeat protein
MNLFQIEQRLKEEPSSPLSVRLASLYVARGRLEEARKLCIEAIEQYPNYATAFAVLARCYAAEKQYEPAIVRMEKLLFLLSDAELPHQLLNNWKQTISKEPDRFKPDVVVLETSDYFTPELATPPVELQQETPLTVETEIINEVKTINEPNTFFPDKDTIEIKTPEENSNTFGTDASEVIAEIQQSVTIQDFPVIIPSEKINEPVHVNEIVEEIVQKKVKDERNDSPSIISITLAEIYAKQGEYHEAIRVYKALIKQRPKQREIFERKIAELSNKLQLL